MSRFNSKTKIHQISVKYVLHSILANILRNIAIGFQDVKRKLAKN